MVRPVFRPNSYVVAAFLGLAIAFYFGGGFLSLVLILAIACVGGGFGLFLCEAAATAHSQNAGTILGGAVPARLQRNDANSQQHCQ